MKAIKGHGFDLLFDLVNIPHGLHFPIHTFDMRQFITEERKFVLIIKEVQLLNIIGSIIRGLSLCRNMKLPHGNLSLSTIFKKGKYDWEISPPLYSRINLKNRRTLEDDYVNIGISGEFAIDYLISPESHEFIKISENCNFYFFHNF